MSGAVFDNSRHPRGDHGRFASSRAAKAIAAAPANVRFGGGVSLGNSVRAHDPNDDRRSSTRGEAWQRVGSKIAAIPVHYTGERTMERPIGSYLHLTLTNQIPKSVPVDDHQARVKRFIQLANDHRKNIIEAATKARAGKKHVYLKANEPAAKGVARWRMKPDKFPEGTPPATLHRAYNHAALLAMHDRGLVDYDFKMDDHLKDELKPTEPFIRYVRGELNQRANIAFPGEKGPYHAEFARGFQNPKFDKVTGDERKRFRPNQQLIKASPLGALVRRTATRAGAALDGLAEDSDSQHAAAETAKSTVKRVRRFFGPKQPGAVNRGGYTAGRAVASSVKSFARNPVRAIKTGVSEGARGGSGFAQGVADEFGASERTRRIAGRVGAVSGALKVPLIAGAIAAKPARMAYQHLGFGQPNQQDNQNGSQKLRKLAEARDIAKRAPEIAAAMQRGE